MPSVKIYSKEQIDDLLSGVTPPIVEQTTGQSTTSVMSQKAVTDSLTSVVQVTGQSTTSVMSQKAVTDNLPSSSQLVPSTTGISAGNVLTVGSNGVEWSIPSGGVSPHTYTSVSELYNAILQNLNCIILIKVNLNGDDCYFICNYENANNVINIRYVRFLSYSSSLNITVNNTTLSSTSSGTSVSYTSWVYTIKNNSVTISSSSSSFDVNQVTLYY